MTDPPLDALGIGATDIDHVGIAVRDLEAVVEHYRMVFGAEPVHREDMESDGVQEALFAVGDSFVQLLAPTGPDTPVGRFLERRGEGVQLADQHPRPGSRGTTVAFAHPKGFAGVLVELVEEGTGEEARE